jgi:hypothetical protein
MLSSQTRLQLKAPNAGAHLLPKAGATQERTLEAVRCSAWLAFGLCWNVFLGNFGQHS